MMTKEFEIETTDFTHLSFHVGGSLDIICVTPKSGTLMANKEKLQAVSTSRLR